MNHDRVLAAMDKEIEEARARLDQLTTARNQYAAAHGVVVRKSPRGGSATADERPAEGSVASALLRAMADGRWWQVGEAYDAVTQQGRQTTRGTVATALATGSGEGGPFERGRRGMYRVRPDVVAGWACAGRPAA